jgi:hypothetical protein
MLFSCCVILKSYTLKLSKVLQADMVYKVANEIDSYARSQSQLTLLPHQLVIFFLKRIQQRLRNIYFTLTCRTTDDVRRRAGQVEPHT